MFHTEISILGSSGLGTGLIWFYLIEEGVLAEQITH